MKGAGRKGIVPGSVPFFSFSLVCLILFFTRSFWILRCSELDHHMGRLYSHLMHRLLHARQDG